MVSQELKRTQRDNEEKEEDLRGELVEAESFHRMMKREAHELREIGTPPF